MFRTHVGGPYKVYDEDLGDDSKAALGGGQIKGAWSSVRKAAGLDWKPVTPGAVKLPFAADRELF